MRTLLLFIFFLTSNIFAQAQNGLLKKDQILTFKNGQFRVLEIKSLAETPLNKVTAGSGNHFIAIWLKASVIKEGAEFASANFVLTDTRYNQYRKPGAWGKIEIMGKMSNFEASKGATMYVRNSGDEINLLFEVSLSTLVSSVILWYEEKPNKNIASANLTTIGNCSLTEIRLFEKGYDFLPKEKRVYSDVFYKDATRFISIEPQFNNELYNKKVHNHTISHIVVKPDGSLLNQTDFQLEVKSEWATFYNNDGGYGWKNTGNWEAGEYKARVTIDGTPVGEKIFSVIDREYSVTSIKVFSYQDGYPELKDRIYSDTYYSDSTKFLSIEVTLKNLQYMKEQPKHLLQLIWYKPEGEIDGNQFDTLVVKPNWKNPCFGTDGWGYREFGKWKPGTYKVKILINGIEQGVKYIEIKDRKKETAQTSKPLPQVKAFNTSKDSGKKTNDQVYQLSTIFKAPTTNTIIQITNFGVRGANNSLYLIYDKTNSGRLSKNDKTITNLTEPSIEVNPGKALTHNGVFIVGMDKDMKAYGTTRYKKIDLPTGEKAWTWMFRRIGAGESEIGTDLDTLIWAITPDSTIIKIGEFDWKKINVGEYTQSSLMVKLNLPGSKWTTSIGDKIYEELNSTMLVQIGWISWRTITLNDATRQTILMTKNMSPRAKWTGRFNGVMYQDQ